MDDDMNKMLVTLMSAMMVLVSGCAGLVTAPAAFTLYDLGPLVPVRRDTPKILPGMVEVRAPTWLANGAMQYRLDYRSPASRETYAETRWVGHPAEMLQRLVGAQYSNGSAPAGQCRLRIELDEFIQSFSNAQDSNAELRARVSLIAPRDESMLATRTFVIDTPAPSPDAAGGVVAHRNGARQFISQLGDWLDALDGEQARGLNIGERCRG